MVDFISALITALKAVPGVKHSQIYNSQFDYLEDGGSWAFPFPCTFVEVAADDFGQLGSSFQAVDLDVKVHIGLDFYNGSQIDENLDIFALRAEVVKAINLFKTPQSGHMLKISEAQDFNHSNVYHYVITYKVHYVDTTAVSPEYLTTPPIDLIIENE